MKASVRVVDTPLGPFAITVQAGAVARIRLPGDHGGAIAGTPAPGDQAVLEEAEHQVLAYVSGRSNALTFPLHPAATPFQAAVRHAMQAIPYGTTRTYAEVAAAVGRPGAGRAVGQACRSNPVPLAVPCHRVVASDGSLGGFMGREGIALKRRLLELEASAAVP